MVPAGAGRLQKPRQHRPANADDQDRPANELMDEPERHGMDGQTFVAILADAETPELADFRRRHIMTIGLTRTAEDLAPVLREFRAVFGASLPMTFSAKAVSVFVGKDEGYQHLTDFALAAA